MWNFCKAPWQLRPRTQATALCCSFDRPQPSVVKGVQACRLPGFKPLQPCVATSTRHSGHSPLLLRAFKPAVCLKPLVQAQPSVLKGVQDVCQAQPSVLRGVQDCRLPGVKRLKPLKPLKRSAAASSRHSTKTVSLCCSSVAACSLPFACIALCC